MADHSLLPLTSTIGEPNALVPAEPGGVSGGTSRPSQRRTQSDGNTTFTPEREGSYRQRSPRREERLPSPPPNTRGNAGIIPLPGPSPPLDTQALVPMETGVEQSNLSGGILPLRAGPTSDTNSALLQAFLNGQSQNLPDDITSETQVVMHAGSLLMRNIRRSNGPSRTQLLDEIESLMATIREQSETIGSIQ